MLLKKELLQNLRVEAKEMEIKRDKDFVYIEGKKYPKTLLDEKYEGVRGVDNNSTILSKYHRKTMQTLLELNI
jgi:hypothetical protein